jgi:hypothetical protein
VNAQPFATPAYRQLFAESDRFRGRLVALQGTLKRITVYDAPDFLRARIGLKTLYEGWLAIPPSGEAVCIVLSHWPDGVPHSGPLDVPVTAAGYFFKRYRYEAQDGWRDAPLLIGCSMSGQPSTESASVLSMRAALPCAAAAMALAILSLWLWIDDRSFRRLSRGVKVRG